MFATLRRWRRQRIIRRFPLSEEQWRVAFARLPLLKGLSDAERHTLRELAILFLHRKSLEGAQGLELDLHKAVVIALQACLPILNLGLDWYDGWVSVVVHPGEFIPRRSVLDEYGVEHHYDDVLSGESWQRGAVVLAWTDIEQAGEVDGYNLLIHEFAHKLDMLNGAANGFPPLHPDMDASQWTEAFGHAFEDFRRHPHPGIDDYAATDPAEFFAVISELFFERPRVLHGHYPRVYFQLKQFYRQDPLARQGGTKWRPMPAAGGKLD